MKGIVLCIVWSQVRYFLLDSLITTQWEALDQLIHLELAPLIKSLL